MKVQLDPDGDGLVAEVALDGRLSMPGPESFITARMATEDALDLVRDERRRQDGLKAAGRFAFTCADSGLSLGEKLSVLVEEVGGVAREVLSFEALVQDGTGTPEALREELVQVAAIAVAWVEALS